MEQGFRQAPTFFAEEYPTARYFAFESISRYNTELKRQNRFTLETPPKSLTIIEFQISKSLAFELKIDRVHRTRIGQEMDLPILYIEGGSEHERILYRINTFNQALKSGQINTRRYRIRLEDYG
ncbi:hypothetical protein NIES4071_82750 [Calothrix sp. NIES-4071]|nr:hypothetical protein NIES4071_82750 [Calothrix sp. NIES-4071]BAZ62544.1 hypothetical protein NIES4105_82680 [Calothrix sp. NIES-4105]